MTKGHGRLTGVKMMKVFKRIVIRISAQDILGDTSAALKSMSHGHKSCMNAEAQGDDWKRVGVNQ